MARHVVEIQYTVCMFVEIEAESAEDAEWKAYDADLSELEAQFGAEITDFYAHSLEDDDIPHTLRR